MKELVNVLTIGNIHHVKNSKDSKLKGEKDKVQFSRAVASTLGLT